VHLLGTGTPVRQREMAQRDRWTAIQVYRNGIKFPPLCPACLAENPTTQIKFRSETHSQYLGIATRHRYLSVSIPHCEGCASGMRWRRWFFTFTCVATMILTVAVSDHFGLGRWIFFVGVAIGAPFVVMGPRLFGKMPAGVELGDYDAECLIFYLKHQQYAAQFRDLNGGIEI
jgi:hypothetical protein